MHFTDLFTTTHNQDVTIHCFLPFCSGLGSLAHRDIDSNMPWIRCFIAFLGLKYSWTYDEMFYFKTTSRQSYVYCLNMYKVEKFRIKLWVYTRDSLYTFCYSNMKFILIFILQKKLLVFVVAAPKAKFSAIIAYNWRMHSTSDPVITGAT